MLPQKEGFGKRGLLASILVFGILLVALLGQNGRFLRAANDEQQFLPYIVKDGDAEDTATPTATATITPTATSTSTPTVTPGAPYIIVLPNCSNSSTAQFNVLGYNWPTNESIALSWNGSPQSIIPPGHPGSFLQTWTKTGLIVGTPDNPAIYVIRAQSNTYTATANFYVPCPGPVTATSTPTATETPTADYCGAFFEYPPLAGTTYVALTGEIGATVTLIDLTTGQTLGTDTFLPDNWQICPGFAGFDGLIPPLIEGHVLLAQPSIGQPDTAVVLSVTPTPTVTGMPGQPTLTLIPNCTLSPDVTLDVLGSNWPTNESIALSWNGSPQSIIPAGHPGNFSQTWTKSGLILGTPEDPVIYEVAAQSNSYLVTADFYAPCPTSAPPDLAILGTPIILSTPPLVAYQPIDVAVVLRNLGGDTPAGQIFFVDIFFDPTVVLSTSIPITQSVGYAAVSGMSSGEMQILTITAPLGFANTPITHTVYSMADSLQEIPETDETNNVSPGGTIFNTTPMPSPTPSPTPVVGTEFISGIVRYRTTSWLPAARATVTLFDDLGYFIATTTTNPYGFYSFNNLLPGTYEVHACTFIDNTSYSGLRTGITPPDSFANMYMLPGPCS